jgi:hypothetical protein
MDMTKPEVTGRKPGASASAAKQFEYIEPPPPPPPLAMTIRQFCDAHRISNAMYFIMKQRGEHPREMRVGAKILVSHEAAAEWRREREADIEARELGEKKWAEGRGRPAPIRIAKTDKPSKIAPKAKRAKLAAAIDA